MRAAYLPASSSHAVAAARTFSSGWTSFMKPARPTTSDQSVVTCSIASGVLANVRSESFRDAIFASFASHVFSASLQAASSCCGVQSVRSGAASTIPLSPPPEPFREASCEQPANTRAATRSSRFMSGSLRFLPPLISPPLLIPVRSSRIAGMQVFHSDRYVVPLPTGHRFPAGKYRMLREILDRDGLIVDAELREAAPIDVDDLLLVHTASYVDSILHGTLGEIDQRRIGLPWSEELVLRSRSSAGGTLAAAFAALEDGVAGNLGGGTHHAFADHGEGYCTFNDHAVAIQRLRLEGRTRRAAFVDLDVHQGNGTAAIFAADPDVFTFSMHAAKNFPFRKQRSSLDIELADGCGDREYLERLEQHLPAVIAGADIVFYQGGVDPLAEDTLGRLSLTHQGLRARDRIVFDAMHARAVPIVLTLG